jgi:hypothetical protein
VTGLLTDGGFPSIRTYLKEHHMSDRSITIEHRGETYSGEIMQIESTHFGGEDHGILTAFIHCKSDGFGVGVGGYGLDEPVKDDQGKFLGREGTAYGLDHLVQIMRTVGVERWEELPGKHVIVLFNGPSRWGSTSVGLASALDGAA